MAAPFFPKQALKFDGALLEEMQGDVSESVARDLIALAPKITPGFVIHDNGCGYGAVTGEIMATNPPSDIKIIGTDKNLGYLAALKKKIAENPSWSVVEVKEMDSNNLEFPDATFDLSISDFVILGLNDEIGALRHIWRTLKPGGTGAIGAWKEKPWQEALKAAHYRTRGADTPLPPYMAVVDYTPEQFRSRLNEAEWKNVQYTDTDAWVKVKSLERWATIAWTFLSTPVGGWKQEDEDNWEKAIAIIVEELAKSNAYRAEEGLHMIRMTATIAIAKKE
ncbi:S-adenosyl-L-methionine-dependent methyltransferase [Lojkania enalia]|uniref:S-adenosyl-L-methionine-dependent methyltransferase n=1 Tax=Lojkania enalia TaxID=147567 RepID=A0A9P4K9D1_9PLEO|nr:S-adenosyl-L-methionine-dependent methyltransferase [Didymosphaeria enalia]